jgi:hypothetical protein
MTSQPPSESPKVEESEQERFERLARGLFTTPPDAVREAERKFKERQKRQPSN